MTTVFACSGWSFPVTLLTAAVIALNVAVGALLYIVRVRRR